jgi:hypothetical protein
MKFQRSVITRNVINALIKKIRYTKQILCIGGNYFNCCVTYVLNVVSVLRHEVLPYRNTSPSKDHLAYSVAV